MNIINTLFITNYLFISSTRLSPPLSHLFTPRAPLWSFLQCCFRQLCLPGGPQHQGMCSHLTLPCCTSASRTKGDIRGCRAPGKIMVPGWCYGTSYTSCCPKAVHSLGAGEVWSNTRGRREYNTDYSHLFLCLGLTVSILAAVGKFLVTSWLSVPFLIPLLIVVSYYSPRVITESQYCLSWKGPLKFI